MTERTAVDAPVGDDLPAPSPAILLMTLGRRLRGEIELDLAASGLTLRHLSALGHLGREPGRSYSELARRAGVTVQSMQATLRQLEALGAVERRTPPGRGRTAELHPTDSGRRLRAAGLAIVAAADERLVAALPEQDATALGPLLMQLHRAGPS
ncbi:MarR family winged helix-turn-helix transcriptional regulator [Pseudonocardia sp. KRD291]|uniref:MarR family winged helix-turn-helix transcriptional regulator n=1 Tax=Pseudonocardia sp. KRD291 TaxID=2792007 RepID=UPI001C4A372B|nr:MarR family transcriptional regulator [Pseudonocardia sp. KRD291]MBW0105136.1 MarR family transcriptional regulator [Pseudonocardia sp. KRD291]